MPKTIARKLLQCSSSLPFIVLYLSAINNLLYGMMVSLFGLKLFILQYLTSSPLKPSNWY